MEHELIDQLDEKGKYVGPIDKAIAHRDGLWHKSIHVYVINDKDEILLQQCCHSKSLYPDYWDISFAGHVAALEDSIAAVVREGKEELGIDVDFSKLQYLFTWQERIVYGNIKSNEFVDVYLLRDNIKLEDLVYQTSEVAKAKYVNIESFFKDVENKKEKILNHEEEYQKMKKILNK